MPSTYRAPEELDDAPELLSLAALVRSTIDRTDGVEPAALSIKPQDGAIVVGGRAPNFKTRDRVLHLARTVARDVSVIDRMMVIR